MVESNYPDVVKIVTGVFDQMDAQTAKYPGLALPVNVKQYPSVLSSQIGNQSLDEVMCAMALHDVYLGSRQSKMSLDDHPLSIEPGAMAKESSTKTLIELGRRECSIPKNGLNLLQEFYFSIYGRRSDLIVTNVYHPESIVMYILNNTPLVSIYNRAKSDMITQALTNYPVVAKFNTAAFKQYMAKFTASHQINDIFIRNQPYKINLNDRKIDLSSGGIWDRNSRTFGTWSPFPKEGDYLYGINIAGFILGKLDNELTGNDRVLFKQQHWEDRIYALCINASMNAYAYSYIFDVIQPA